MDLFKFEDNYATEETIPGMQEFYKNYALKILSVAGIKQNNFTSFYQIVNQLKQLKAQGNGQAYKLLVEMYRDGLIEAERA